MNKSELQQRVSQLQWKLIEAGKLLASWARAAKDAAVGECAAETHCTCACICTGLLRKRVHDLENEARRRVTLSEMNEGIDKLAEMNEGIDKLNAAANEATDEEQGVGDE